MLVWNCVYMFVFLVFWTWLCSYLIPYWVSVILVTHTLGFESKRCSYATLHSHSLSRFRRCFPRWFLNIFAKFLSLHCACGSHDSYSEDGFKIRVRRPENGRRTRRVRVRQDWPNGQPLLPTCEPREPHVDSFSLSTCGPRGPHVGDMAWAVWSLSSLSLEMFKNILIPSYSF